MCYLTDEQVNVHDASCLRRPKIHKCLQLLYFARVQRISCFDHHGPEVVLHGADRTAHKHTSSTFSRTHCACVDGTMSHTLRGGMVYTATTTRAASAAPSGGAFAQLAKLPLAVMSTLVALAAMQDPTGGWVPNTESMGAHCYNVRTMPYSPVRL